MAELVFGIVVNKNKKILVISRKDLPVFALPGGHVEYGEDPKQAIVREIEEETGIKTNAVPIVSYYPTILLNYTALYLCKPIGGNQTKESKYISFEDASKILFPPFNQYLQDFLKPSSGIKKHISPTNLFLVKYVMTHPIRSFKFFLTSILGRRICRTLLWSQNSTPKRPPLT